MVRHASPSIRSLLLMVSVGSLLCGSAVLYWRIEERAISQRGRKHYVLIQKPMFFSRGARRWTEEGERYDAQWRRVAYISLCLGLVCGLAVPIYHRPPGILLLIGTTCLLIALVQVLDAYPTFGFAVTLGSTIVGLTLFLLGIVGLTHRGNTASQT